MPTKYAVVTFVFCACLLGASASQARQDKSRVLTFEAEDAGELHGWYGGPAGTLFRDSTLVHEGRYSGRVERIAGSPSTFSTFTLDLPIDFTGRTLELRGWMKYENVTGYVGLWQRQDGPAGMLAFDNMGQRQLKGTADWAEYSVPLALAPGATSVFLGGLLSGAGRLWLDDLRLYVDDKPLADAPVIVRTPSVLETDREFDAGSKVETGPLAAAQVENLVLLGKVWGFLKYHHPAIVAGRRHWDYDLFRVLPAVLTARDHDAGQKLISAWVASLGEARPCSSCVQAPRGRPSMPRLAWLADSRLLGRDLSARLVAIHARRPDVDSQFFVSQAPTVKNPAFDNEPSYTAMDEPDAGYRLLALYRFWNIVEYWYPNRDVIGEDWDGVLREFAPRLAGADTRDTYAAAMMALIARVHDTHANLWSSLDVRPPRGRAQVPVRIRFAEGQAVVCGYAHDRLGPACGLQVGDAILAIDGVPVDTLVARWRPMYAASNEPTLLRDMARALTQGSEGPVRLAVLRGGASVEVNATRAPFDSLDRMGGTTHDLPGPTLRRLSGEVAYLKLSTVKTDAVAEYLRGASGARCLVIDIRNYPSAFMVFELGKHLVREPTDFARFTKADTRNPGAFDWTPPTRLLPESPYFDGGVAILVDEVSQSQAEYTAMAFRARPGAVVVGSTTAGADGNVSAIALPGGLRTMISGIGVFYPDHRPTQRVGILPDLEVRPTIAGIRAGRDEVLEAAVQRLLGRPMTDAERMATRASP